MQLCRISFSLALPLSLCFSGCLPSGGVLEEKQTESMGLADTAPGEEPGDPTPLPSSNPAPSPSPSAAPSPIPPVSGAVSAFPGAHGFGKDTRGAYALYHRTRLAANLPKIIKISNLNDSGAGSLRDCAEASGPRICVVTVDGIIQLSKAITVRNPYLTLAGQTAPGDGILVRGKPFIVRRSDVIVRNVRFRLGRGAGSGIDAAGVIADSESINNVIFDHCSFTWGTDENFAINSGQHKIGNVTV